MMMTHLIESSISLLLGLQPGYERVNPVDRLVTLWQNTSPHFIHLFSCRTGPTLLPPPPRRFAPREKGRSRRRRSRWRWEETATQKNWFSIYHTAPRGLCILRLWLSQHSPNGWEAKQPKIGLTLSHVFIFFSTRLLLICSPVSAFLSSSSLSTVSVPHDNLESKIHELWRISLTAGFLPGGGGVLRDGMTWYRDTGKKKPKINYTLRWRKTKKNNLGNVLFKVLKISLTK